MKYPAHIYAKALVEVLADEEKKGAFTKEQQRVADNFVALVRRNGDEAHLRKLLEEASRMARGLGGARKVIVESARPFTSSQRKEVERFIKKEDVVVEKVDPALVAGMRITVNDEMQFDGSLRRKLAELLPF